MTTPVQLTASACTTRFLPVRSGRLRAGRRMAPQLHARLLARALAMPNHLVDLLRPDADAADLAQQVLDTATCATSPSCAA
ncbi:hypothetical protein [Aquabacterium sp.]|uniref:hypothetical protein n=1 Tax=Aquabacterium sp. TaxID=1872578 RepID=UPI002CF04637|nr:hypothetical protein [Aquabacterium sp.]HSW03437.1 hypothetical protein [Aquabacterium sp.]